jgi:hypothetical protein
MLENKLDRDKGGKGGFDLITATARNLKKC